MVKLFPVLVLLVVLFIVYIGLSSKESYRFLGDNSPSTGGHHAELNEDCLQFPLGKGKCVLTDGTSGTCVQNGLCVQDMLIDLNLENIELKKPYCSEPTFKENCGIFCDCKAMEGPIDKASCVQSCRSWFSPL